MARDTKAAKFFCENCGAEVPKDAKMCRHCGRFFSSVRCPQCGTTGTPEKFSKGCPTCGYAVGGSNSKSNFNSKDNKKAGLLSRRKLKKAINDRNDAINGTVRGDESLPWWMYLLMFCCLGAVVTLFLYFM